MVKVLIGDKVYQTSKNMAGAILELARDKFSKQNVNAVYAIEKANVLVLKKDVYDNTVALDKAVNDWKCGGYKCYYTKAKMEANVQ